MKYIITESKLEDVMTMYLESLTKAHEPTYTMGLIIISVYEGDDHGRDVMEYDKKDGRLWINREYFSQFMKLFPIELRGAKKFISDWFSNKFGVKISRVDF